MGRFLHHRCGISLDSQRYAAANVYYRIYYIVVLYIFKSVICGLQCIGMASCTVIALCSQAKHSKYSTTRLNVVSQGHQFEGLCHKVPSVC